MGKVYRTHDARLNRDVAIQVVLQCFERCRMTIRERSVGDVTILDIGGRITVDDGADIFGAAVRQLVRQGRWRLVLNLHDATYIDSTALGEIVQAYTSATRRGGSLKLLQVTARVHQLLVITRLLSVFDVFDDEAEAVTSFASSEPR